jgi:hypothetical protein
VCLFYLIEKYYRVGPSPDSLGKLPSLVIPDISEAR